MVSLWQALPSVDQVWSLAGQQRKGPAGQGRTDDQKINTRAVVGMADDAARAHKLAEGRKKLERCVSFLTCKKAAHHINVM